VGRLGGRGRRLKDDLRRGRLLRGLRERRHDGHLDGQAVRIAPPWTQVAHLRRAKPGLSQGGGGAQGRPNSALDAAG
jgi:hypothetical protein